MRGGLWLIRLLLLVAVSAIVFSPLVVHGEASTPRSFDLDYDVSALALPSSPVYPAVTAYREVRLALSDGNCDKARASLSFANDDAAAIMELALRQRYTEAVQHAATYRDSFDRSVGWTVIAGQHGTNVSSLMASLKNEHQGQQVVLAQASALLPDWASEGLEVARAHAASVLVEAIGVLEDANSAEMYRSTIAQMHPDIAPEAPAAPELAAIEETPATNDQPEAEAVQAAVFDASISQEDDGLDATSTQTAVPDIASMSVRPSPVAPGETCRISCNVASAVDTPLQYTWSSRKGDLDPGGSHTDWTAPDKEGTYKISVVVIDRNGNSDSASIDVHVRVAEKDDTDPDVTPAPMNPSPDGSVSATILSCVATADHKYLEESLAGYAILVGRSCTLTCSVDDPASIDFEWTANAGTFSGEGPTVTWNAPHSVGNFTVTVVTRNQDGEEDTAILKFHCTTCSQCF